MSYDATKHDLGLLRADTTTKIGLMLVRDPKTGKPAYDIIDDEYLIQQQAAVPGYDNLQPEKEIRVGAASHRSGFGLDVYDALDPERYLSSTNFDLRFKNMAICGPKATGITLALPTYTPLNPNFENWSAGDPDSWTPIDSDEAVEETVIVKSGSSLKFELGTEDTSYVTQAFTNPTEWIGFKLTLTAWAITVDSNYDTCTLHLYRNGASVASDNTTSETWASLSVSYVVPAGTTSLEIRLHSANTSNIASYDCYWDSVGLSYVAAGNPVACAEFNNELYWALGKVLTKLNGDGDGLDALYTFDNDITDLEAFVDDNLYIALGKANAYYYMSTAEALTASTDDEGKADFFETVAVTMWKAKTPRTLMSATDPTNPGSGTNWSTTTTVDSSSYDITDLVSDGTSLYIPKEDRCFYLDSNGAVQTLIGETKHIAASTSGKNTVVWKQKIYYPCGDQSLVEYDAGTITWRSPALYCTNLSAFNSRVQALAGDNQWLHTILDNGDDVEVLAGRLETIDSTTKFVWHPIAHFDLTGCETAFVSSVYQKRLWIASTDSTDSLYYIPLYTGYGDPVNDTNKYFQTGGYFITPWLHGQFKGDNKVWIKLTLTMEDVDTNVYFKAYYQLKSDAAWSSSIGSFQTEPSTTHYITTATSDVISNKTDIYIRFKIEAITNSTSSTPVLKGYDCRAILKPTKRNVISATVKCDDEVVDKEGNSLEDVAETIATALREAKNTEGLVTIWDITGTAKYVNVLAHPNFEQIIETEKDRVIKRIFNLLLQTVALS